MGEVCMLKAIVYKSNTGHTMQYAKMLSEKVNIPYFTINEAKNNLKKQRHYDWLKRKYAKDKKIPIVYLNYWEDISKKLDLLF